MDNFLIMIKIIAHVPTMKIPILILYISNPKKWKSEKVNFIKLNNSSADLDKKNFRLKILNATQK